MDPCGGKKSGAATRDQTQVDNLSPTCKDAKLARLVIGPIESLATTAMTRPESRNPRNAV
jgi:hypothetical protein